MTVLVDTAILIDHLRGKAESRQPLRSAADGGRRVAASVVTKVEVLAGMRPSEEDRTRQLLDVIDWVKVDEAIAEQAEALANPYPALPPRRERVWFFRRPRFMALFSVLLPIGYVINAATLVAGTAALTRYWRRQRSVCSG